MLDVCVGVVEGGVRDMGKGSRLIRCRIQGEWW